MTAWQPDGNSTAYEELGGATTDLTGEQAQALRGAGLDGKTVLRAAARKDIADYYGRKGVGSFAAMMRPEVARQLRDALDRARVPQDPVTPPAGKSPEQLRAEADASWDEEEATINRNTKH